MYPIKQSTAITVPFFVHDASGDAVTGLTDGSFTKRISKNGGAFAAMTVTITEMENGWYSIPLSTSHSDTLGLLTIVFTNAGAKQVNLQFRVTAKLVDDLNDVAATDIVSSGAITTSGGAVSTVSTLTGHTAQTGDSFARLGAPVGASISADIAGVQSDTDDIQTRLPAALVSGKMDSNVSALAGVAASATNIEASTDTILRGTASGTPTTTTMVSDIGVTVDDQFNGRTIIFASDTATAALRGQATDITGCTAATNTLTFTALTTAPSSGDTFVIV